MKKPKYCFDKLLDKWNGGFSIRLFRNDIWFCDIDQLWQIKWILFFLSYRTDNDISFNLLSLSHYCGYPRIIICFYDMRLTIGFSYIYEYTDK